MLLSSLVEKVRAATVMFDRLGFSNTSCRGALNQVGVVVGARRGKGVGFSVTLV
jgi:hypothetical protein